MIRRRALLFGLGGAVLLAGGATAVRLSTGYPPGAEIPVATTEKELAIVRAIVEALLPADGDLPAGVAVGVVQRIDEELWSQSPETRADLTAALGVLEYWPVLSGRGSRLTRLPPAERVAVLASAMARAPRPVARAATALKQLCHLFYYSSDATWAAIGYDGPLVPTPRPPPSSAAYRALLDERRRAR